MQPGTVQHYPKVIYFNTQQLADLFTLETVNLAQGECAGGTLWQRRQAVVEYFPEVVPFDQLRRCYVPFTGSVTVVPMALPGFRSFEELTVLRPLVRFFAERGFPAGATKVIHDLVLEYSCEPGSF